MDVAVEDPGPPFDPLAEPHRPPLGAGIEQRPVGGLGIHLVRRLTTRLAYARTPEGRNRLTFRVV
jgi:anti-sigma regulatory factor (Ser/Thr protein kinase)